QVDTLCACDERVGRRRALHQGGVRSIRHEGAAMSGEAALQVSLWISGILLAIAMVCAAVRIVRGPTVPDRVVALDMLTLIGVAVTGLAVVVSGSAAFIDVA